MSKTDNTSTKFTIDSLPLAVGNLFELNNYSVEYDVHVHGAQIDIVARSKSDPFASPIYIEVTVEYVSTEKYGKDTTKFILVKHKNPGSTCLCISSKGFTAFVKERATESGIRALSYDELFSQFEKFSSYADSILENLELKALESSYEEPFFGDVRGTDYATKWLGQWRAYAPDKAKWLIVLGEYGTGKTSLTKILQRRWLADYKEKPTNPIPIRIELRNFSRQFDSQGLLHHFLDNNNLGHIPIQFLTHLIRSGRVILILDGYDEMAQFLNARERRACLSALADLASDGAKGILTSRPNYFNESEELTVFEALYTSLEQSKYHISKKDMSFITEEKNIDQLVGRYVLDRYERVLQDLTQVQTESLVKKNLKNDAKGQRVVLSILKKLFRDGADGSKQALSGKPVIITYLLELVDELRSDPQAADASSLSEWQIYKMIVDRLMFRDLRRSPLNPDLRRGALQKVAIALSSRANIVADEHVFRSVIEDLFKNELRRMSVEDRKIRQEELFEDLRSSATLTRANDVKGDGWTFSHNSLREYLVVEYYLSSLIARLPDDINLPLTSAMRNFASSISKAEFKNLTQVLSELWPQRATTYSLGPYLTLLWDGMQIHSDDAIELIMSVIGSKSNHTLIMSGIRLKSLDISICFKGSKIGILASNSDFDNCTFDHIDLRYSKFDATVLDSSSFKNADLSASDFNGSLIFECDFTDTIVLGADFRGIQDESNFIVIINNKSTILSGKEAIGYLNFNGAITDNIDPYYIYKNHAKFAIVEKICVRLFEQRNSQLRGLTQRGEAQADPPFARDFVDMLSRANILKIDKNDLVSLTSSGRTKVGQLIEQKLMPAEIENFIKNRI